MAMPTTVYMSLLNEGTKAWAPVAAEQIGPEVYRLLGPISDDDEWQFGAPGDVVRVAARTFSGGSVCLAVIGPEAA
jgi:hypothetical protein